MNDEHMEQIFRVNVEDYPSIKTQKIEFWTRRIKNVRLWAIMCTVSNWYYQLTSILAPKSRQHKMVNIYYCIMSLIITLMILLSFKGGKFLRLIFPSMVLTNIRQLIRMFDFEGTRQFISNEEWIQLMFLQMYGSVLNLTFFFNNFNFTKGQKWLLVELNSVLNLGSMMFGSQKSIYNLSPTFAQDFIKNTIAGVIVFHVYFALEKDVNSEFFDEMNKKVGAKIEQEMLLENLEESIVIV